MKNTFFPFLLFLCLTVSSYSQTVIRDSLFDFNWKFFRGQAFGAEKSDFNDKNWRVVNLPHDWSIEDLPAIDNSQKAINNRIVSGPFDSQVIGGVKTDFMIGGTGWYRKHFTASEIWSGKIVSIHFDGVYMNSDVWINGHHLGNHPYGYTAFWFDLSKYLNYGDKENVLSVQVKNEGNNSRWYSGSGIYRHVKLSVVDKIHVESWGVYITTPKVDSINAEVRIQTTLDNQTAQKKDIEFNIDIISPGSKMVASKKVSTRLSNNVPSLININLAVPKPELWSTDSPHLYKMVCTIQDSGKVLDKIETAFGIRSLKFDSENGFFLNGKNIKLKGGAMHANNGPLGASAFDRAEERRVELMKNAGYNAIRCAHNPPSTAFLNACDRLGMMVFNEAFDVWLVGWRPDDYHVYFKDWWQRDIQSMILRDRNHPSIIVWGVGNQVREARDSIGISLAYQIADYTRSLDPSRPVSANIAMHMNIKGNWLDGSQELWHDYDPIFGAFDVCGYSYQSAQYVTDHNRLPDRIMLSTEINPRDCFRNWMRAIDNKYVLGNFTWPAIDYFGETSGDWHFSSCGDIDICGYKKPRSFYRDILFNNKNILSIFVSSPTPSIDDTHNSPWGWADVKPSWTWPGFENKSMSVEAYSACDSVELKLNGKSLGIKATSRATEFKASWDVPYHLGTLTALGYKNNRKVSENKLITADKPYKVKLTADKRVIKADKQDLSFITTEVLDEKGILVPYAENLIEFTINGEGTIAAVGNSNPKSVESFQQPYRKAYEGRCLLIIKANDKMGTITINASSNGLKSDTIEIKVQ